jgi:hypothetical protein
MSRVLYTNAALAYDVAPQQVVTLATMLCASENCVEFQSIVIVSKQP